MNTTNKFWRRRVFTTQQIHFFLNGMPFAFRVPAHGNHTVAIHNNTADSCSFVVAELASIFSERKIVLNSIAVHGTIMLTKLKPNKSNNTATPATTNLFQFPTLKKYAILVTLNKHICNKPHIILPSFCPIFLFLFPIQTGIFN